MPDDRLTSITVEEANTIRHALNAALHLSSSLDAVDSARQGLGAPKAGALTGLLQQAVRAIDKDAADSAPVTQTERILYPVQDINWQTLRERMLERGGTGNWRIVVGSAQAEVLVRRALHSAPPSAFGQAVVQLRPFSAIHGIDRPDAWTLEPDPGE